MYKKLFIFHLLLTAFMSIPAVSMATTVERLTLEDLAKRAHSIVMGKVSGSRTFWSPDGKLIFTTYTIVVQESMKGLSTPVVNVTTIGGTMGDVILHVAGMPVFHDGESAIVFVEQSGTYSTVLGLTQGKFTVSQGEVSNTVAGLTFPNGLGASALKMPVEAFKKQIRSVLDRQP